MGKPQLIVWNLVSIQSQINLSYQVIPLLIVKIFMILLFPEVQPAQDSDETCGQIGSSPVCIQEATGMNWAVFTDVFLGCTQPVAAGPSGHAV